MIVVSTGKDTDFTILKYYIHNIRFNNNFNNIIPLKINNEDDPYNIDVSLDNVKITHKKMICNFATFSKNNKYIIAGISYSYRINSILKYIGILKVLYC